MTLRELAGELGLDFTYLSKIENGSDVPGDDTLRKIALKFGVNADELLGLAGKVPAELRERARQERPMGQLLRRLPNLSAEAMRQIYEAAGIEDPDKEGE
jgi:transcriptional regulator with XRE-family HTH domain